MMIHCEICGLRDGDKVRIGDHTKLGEAIDLKLPLKGHMVGSPNKLREIPPPFPSVDDWKDFRCPRCARVPFMFMPEDLDRYNAQGGPDRVYTDTGWYYLVVQSKEKPEKCPSCGKPKIEFKNFANHVRFCQQRCSDAENTDN